MECRLDQSHAKILAKAVESLSKFGTELFLEALKEGLLLRSINSTRSAVGTFKFNKSFFENYRIDLDSGNNSGNGTGHYCKITMKACLNVFRNMKQVERCELRIIAEESGTNKFQINVKCRYEQIKNVTISVVDEENITAEISEENTTNFISASHKIFNEISGNFNALEEEVTFEVNIDGLTAKNYVECTRVNDRFMRSQLKLGSSEFDTYNINSPTAITFCLKEFRAFLYFAEAVNENLQLHFEDAGSPIFFRIRKSDILECVLIMSTLSPDDVTFLDNCQESEVMDISRETPNTTNKRKLRQPKEDNNKRTENNEVQSKKRHIAEALTLSNDKDDDYDNSLFRFNAKPNNNIESLNSIETVRNQATNTGSCVMQDNHEVNEPLSSHNDDVRILHMDVIPQRQSESVSVTFCDTEENEPILQRCPSPINDEQIPQSPPRNNVVRSIFSRCFQATYIPEQPSPNSQIYVPDSDNED